MADYLSKNSNYIVQIRRTWGGHNISANAQAKLQIQVNNQWVNILQALGFSGASSNPISQLIGSSINALQIFSGNNFLPEIATSHVWRGSNGIEIQLVLRFDAVNDAYEDVVKPTKSLIAMYMPRRGGAANARGILDSVAGALPGLEGLTGTIKSAFLEPPGPTPYEYATGAAADKLVSVMLGKALLIPKLIPTALAWEFENRFTDEGHPIAAQVTCGFMSYTTPDSNDVLSYFTGGVGGLSGNISAGAGVGNAIGQP